MKPPKPVAPYGAALLLAAGSLLIPAGVPAAGPPAQPQESVVTMGENSAEITLPRPTRYAALLHEAGKFRTLHAQGNVVFQPEDPSRSVTIERVEADAVLLRESRKAQPRWVRVGQPIPGFPGLRFTGIVVLDRVQYRSKLVEHLTHADPVIVAIQGSRAVVEVEVLGTVPSPASPSVGPPSSKPPTPPSQQRRKLDPALFAEVPVKELAPNTYEVNAASLMRAIQNAGQVLADLQPMMVPALSAQSGLTFELTSAVVDGTLSSGGFTVTNPKVAQRFGIEVGDRISRINGQAVTSPLNAWWAYQEFIIRNPLESEMRVDLQRKGIPITKMYQLR